MDAPTLLRTAFRDLHKELLEDTDGLEPDDLFWQPGENLNHAGFLLWHIVRDEDTVICQAVLQKPELWQTNGWAARMGMDAREQGTGFDAAGLSTFRYDPETLFGYASEVWEQTDSAIARLDPARLGEDLSWSITWRLSNLLTTGCLSHGWVHLGEIRAIRGLRGWKFRE